MNSGIRGGLARVAVILVGALGCATPSAGDGAGSDSLRVAWPQVGGDDGARHYSPLRDIERANVMRLERAWVWQTPDRPRTVGSAKVGPGNFESTPIMIGDTLFVSTGFARVAALDAESGRQLWLFDPRLSVDSLDFDPQWGLVHRGVAQRVVDGRRRIYINAGPRLYAIDAGTGRPIASFGDSASVDLTAGLRWPANPRHVRSTSAPVIAGDLVVVGSAIPDRLVHDRDPPGAVLAFDATTGAKRWVWHAVPAPGTPGSETWETGATERVGHANVWSPMTVDTARGLLFANVSAASNDFYGGRRKGANLYSESLVCLDVSTGMLRWYFQYIHHGLWDQETAAPPMLVTIDRDGTPRDIVAVPGKTGFLYVFDRETGQPLWPIEERAVASSDVPGEEAWPTQPHPTWPPPFSQQGITDDDLADFTPRVQELAREEVRGMRLGKMFDPPSLQGTVLLPGWTGGAGWGGGAFDPDARRLYVKSTRNPILARVVSADTSVLGSNSKFFVDMREPPHRALDIDLPRRHRYLWFRTVLDPIPLVKPPYGMLAAYDFGDGSLAWNVVAGDHPRVRNHPALRGLGLPRLGSPGPSGPIVTAGGLVFVTGGGASLLALDASTGAQLWEGPLGEASGANPMTYRTRSGRQFVVVGAGFGEAGRLVAFALPGTGSR